jgi:multidrug efflux pump subunit AcrB
MSKYPSSYIYFGGEVQDSRESTNDFLFGIILVISLIYIVLALLFNSLGLPFIILLIVPFGVIGVVLAYFFHGIQLYGFFTMIGILGLTGVVVNDSIVMLSKLLETQNQKKRVLTDFEISKVVQTRLRAVLLTTMTTVAALFPTAYGVAGYDSMLSEMMLAMGWGLLFGTVITLILTPTIFSLSGWMRSKVFGKEL